MILSEQYTQTSQDMSKCFKVSIYQVIFILGKPNIIELFYLTVLILSFYLVIVMT